MSKEGTKQFYLHNTVL